MKRQIIKRGKKIIGFVYQKQDGSYWYAFGRPSQDNYISFKCRDFEHGTAQIEMHRPIGHF